MNGLLGMARKLERTMRATTIHDMPPIIGRPPPGVPTPVSKSKVLKTMRTNSDGTPEEARVPRDPGARWHGNGEAEARDAVRQHSFAPETVHAAGREERPTTDGVAQPDVADQDE